MNKIKFHSVVIDIILTILTIGFWNFYVQYRQIKETNELLGYDKIPSIIVIIILSIITFGIYFCYHEYRLTRELHKLYYKRTFPFPEISIALTTYLGLWFITDSYQQMLLNELINKQIN